MIKYYDSKIRSDLFEKRKNFCRQPLSVRQKHTHQFEKVFLWHPPALLNSRTYNACIICGKMVEIPQDEEMQKEIRLIQDEMTAGMSEEFEAYEPENELDEEETRLFIDKMTGSMPEPEEELDEEPNEESDYEDDSCLDEYLSFLRREMNCDCDDEIQKYRENRGLPDLSLK